MTPVIATGEGGALDSVVPGRTGELVTAGEDGLIARWAPALAGFDPGRYDSATVRTHAEGFSRVIFRQRMADHVDRVLSERVP